VNEVNVKPITSEEEFSLPRSLTVRT